MKRLVEARLITEDLQVRSRAASEWLIHGVKYFQPARFGGLTRGLPTSFAAPPLNSEIVHSFDKSEPPPVWESMEGDRGIALEPIYKTVPLAAKRDIVLYEYLALVDAIRSGRARESQLATLEIQRRLGT